VQLGGGGMDGGAGREAARGAVLVHQDHVVLDVRFCLERRWCVHAAPNHLVSRAIYIHCTILPMSETPSGPQEQGGAYWYGGDDSSVALLSALRSFRMADQDLRRRMSEGMDMNTTDLAALRFVIARELGGEPVTPRGLAEHLHISGPSVSKLLDRLTAS